MDSHECSHSGQVHSVYQTLGELDFERGIWGAALDGNIGRIENILNKGSNPSVCDSSGYTALHYAARNGKESACKILLKHGAKPNVQTPGGATPLHRAAYVGHTSIVSLLLQHNADTLLSDSDGKTALHKAVEGQHLAVAKILVTSNPELKKLKDKKGFLPVDYVNERNTEIAHLLSA